MNAWNQYQQQFARVPYQGRFGIVGAAFSDVFNDLGTALYFPAGVVGLITGNFDEPSRLTDAYLTMSAGNLGGLRGVNNFSKLAVDSKILPSPINLKLSAEFFSVDLSLNYKPGWTAAQRAEADAKIRILNDAPTIVTASDRSGTAAAMSRYRKNETPSVGKDVDHKVDLQLGGGKTYDNLWYLDSSVNRSFGSQIQYQIKDLPVGTRIDQVTVK